MLTLFAGDITSPNAIPVSVRLKEARELLGAGRVDGAALLALEARITMSRRGGPRGTYAASMVPDSGSMKALLDAWAADEKPPMDELIRTDAIPFLASLRLESSAVAPAKSVVTVTLVRWPYT
jgi:hypothetical protein